MGRNGDISPVGSLADYVKVPEAAKILGKSARSVKGYLSAGALKARRFKGQGISNWIRRADVVAFKKIGGERELSTHDLWSFLKGIKVRLHSIESKIDFLMRVNGLDISGLRDISDEDLIKLYQSICDLLVHDIHDVSFREMDKWAELFCQFTEIEFDRLWLMTQEMRPWYPIHATCIYMMRSLRRRKHFTNNHDMQQTYRLLDKARTNLSRAIVVYMEAKTEELGPAEKHRLHAVHMFEDSLGRYIEAELTYRCPRSAVS